MRRVPHTHKPDAPNMYENGCAVCQVQKGLADLCELSDDALVCPWKTVQEAILEDLHWLYVWHGIPTASEMEELLLECY